ncbi:hypothetical protein LguiA_021363 [Lonicera macranthoides]
MAVTYRVITIALFFALFTLSSVELSTCYVLKGSVTCLDCNHRHSHFSGIMVLVKCSRVKNATIATTKPDGSFEAKLPSHTLSSNCRARILGASNQLYGSTKNMVRTIVKARGSKPESYAISKPLEFYKKCPLKAGNCGPKKIGLGSSKTIDIPLPREWGLAPSSYYVTPFLPVIAFTGIP